jgi:acyl carrier protein
MSRAEVVEKVRDHLSTELEIDPDRIQESSNFRDDLDADSLDLYELVMELEDTYAVKMSEEEAAGIVTVGQAVDFVLERVPSA